MSMSSLAMALANPSFGQGLFQVGQAAAKAPLIPTINANMQQQQGAERDIFQLLQANDVAGATTLAAQHNIAPSRIEAMTQQVSVQQDREAMQAYRKSMLQMSQDAAQRQKEADKLNKTEANLTNSYLSIPPSDTKGREAFENKLRAANYGTLAEGFMSARLDREEDMRLRRESMRDLSSPVDTSHIERRLSSLPKEIADDFAVEIAAINKAQPDFKNGGTWPTAGDKNRAEAQLEQMSKRIHELRVASLAQGRAQQRADANRAADIQDQINKISLTLSGAIKIPKETITAYGKRAGFLTFNDDAAGYAKAEAEIRTRMVAEMKRLKASLNEVGGMPDIIKRMEAAIAAKEK